MQGSYIYPAIFTYDPRGTAVEFPDLPGCVTCGETAEEAFWMAQDALEGYLSILEEDREPIPTPTPLPELHAGRRRQEGGIHLPERATINVAALELLIKAGPAPDKREGKDQIDRMAGVRRHHQASSAFISLPLPRVNV